MGCKVWKRPSEYAYSFATGDSGRQCDAERLVCFMESML